MIAAKKLIAGHIRPTVAQMMDVALGLDVPFEKVEKYLHDIIEKQLREF